MNELKKYKKEFCEYNKETLKIKSFIEKIF